ncbi:MAG: hypothetical protein N4A53_08080 [Pelagimonas sp.]|jgi:hypothetical protein|nr:hypothetical protein [Pelagimonas sp.]
MTFVIDQERKFQTKVQTICGQSFDATFKLLSDEELREIKFVTPDVEKDFLRQVVLDLGDIEGAAGEKIAFSSELLEQMIANVDLRSSMLTAYYTTRAKGLAGN